MCQIWKDKKDLNSVSGYSSTSFGGAYTRPPAAHSSVNSVSGNSSTTFGGAYMYARPPAAYSSVFTCPPWHSSNPFVVVNLNNEIKRKTYTLIKPSAPSELQRKVIGTTISKCLVSPPDTQISLLQC